MQSDLEQNHAPGWQETSGRVESRGRYCSMKPVWLRCNNPLLMRPHSHRGAITRTAGRNFRVVHPWRSPGNEEVATCIATPACSLNETHGISRLGHGKRLASGKESSAGGLASNDPWPHIRFCWDDRMSAHISVSSCWSCLWVALAVTT